jgi:hypothetical protein
MQPSTADVNQTMKALCHIHPEGGQIVVEHILRILSAKEFRNVKETIMREAWLITEERERQRRP